MGHHFDDQGRFQSDKHPELPPDRIRLSLEAPRSLRALLCLAEDYRNDDPGLSEDLEKRLREIHSDDVDRAEQAMLIVADCDGTMTEELRDKIEAFIELKGSKLHRIQIIEVTEDESLARRERVRVLGMIDDAIIACANDDEGAAIMDALDQLKTAVSGGGNGE